MKNHLLLAFSILTLLILPCIFSCNKSVYSSTAGRSVGIEDAVIAATEGAVISSRKKHINIESILPWEQLKFAVINYADGRQIILPVNYDNEGKLLGHKGTIYQDYQIAITNGAQWFLIKAWAKRKTAYLQYAFTGAQDSAIDSTKHLLPVYSQPLWVEDGDWKAVGSPGSQVIFMGNKVVNPADGALIESVALRF